MKKNISINIDLRKFKHAIFTTKKGAECIAIPIDSNQLFRGKKGIYFEMTGYPLQEQTAEQSHILKQSFPKEHYASLSDAEKKELPIFGNVKIWQPSENEPNETESPVVQSTDDLPF